MNKNMLNDLNFLSSISHFYTSHLPPLHPSCPLQDTFLRFLAKGSQLLLNETWNDLESDGIGSMPSPGRQRTHLVLPRLSAARVFLWAPLQLIVTIDWHNLWRSEATFQCQAQILRRLQNGTGEDAVRQTSSTEQGVVICAHFTAAF